MDLVGSLVKESLPELFTEGQVLAAEQSFHRKLAEYEMNIEQQKLFREDLRDLVELTVGRMDVYHLVGALLLEFCIHFYCENEMLESDGLPTFVSTIFLLSNLAATGFLVFAVWLSMHASVASHSIGVRLLTRFARISIPSRKELESVAQAPLMPLKQRFETLRQRLRGAGVSLASSRDGASNRSSTSTSGAVAPGDAGASSAASASTPAARRPPGAAAAASGSRTGSTAEVQARQGPQAASQARPQVAVSCPADAAPVARSGPGQGERVDSFADTFRGLAIEEGERAQADRQRHFRRFLREQRRWLCYDAYARVCMSLGINQMFLALSYYIIGKVALKSPMAAMVSLLGFQAISFLLFRLDLTQGFHAGKETLTIVCFIFLPPIYIGSIGWIQRHTPYIHKVMLQYLLIPGYLLHGGWFLIIAKVLTPDTADVLAIPRRLRTVLYLDVLNLEQEEVATAVIAQESRSFTDELRTLCSELEQEMKAMEREEQEAGALSNMRRKSPELMMLKGQLEELVDEVRTRTLGSTEPELRTAAKEARRAEWILERLNVWQEAPKVVASLQALQNFQVQSYMKEEDRELITRAQSDFLQLSGELDLHICAPEPAEEDGVGSSASSAVIQPSASAVVGTQSGDLAVSSALSMIAESSASSSNLSRLVPLEVDPAERPSVRVEYDYGYGAYEPASVWIKPSRDRLSNVQHTAPDSLELTTDVSTMLGGTLPTWRSQAEQLLRRPRTPQSSFGEARITAPPAPGGAEVPEEAATRRLAERRIASFASTWESSENPLMPQSATPPDELPRITVKRFTFAMAFLWFASAAAHFFSLLSARVPEVPPELILQVRRLLVTWPEPAGVFDVASLHCNGSVVAVDSGFSLYVAQRAADTLGPLRAIGETGVQAMLCASPGCDVLSLAGESQKGTLQLVSLTPALSEGAVNAGSLLQVPPTWRRVAATMAPCSPEPCEALALAGWNGTQVVVGRAQRRTPGGAWQVQSRFAVWPGRGRGRRHPESAGEEYGEVRALQLGAEGRSLAVLHGQGLLDAWDLTAVVRVGQWQLASDALAMCHDSHEILLARGGQNAEAIVLEAVPLPRGLAEVGHPWTGEAESIEEKPEHHLQRPLAQTLV